MTERETLDGLGPRPFGRVWRAGLSLALISAVAFAVVAPPERCPSVTATELELSAQAAVDWFVRNQEPDGTWLYQYDAENDLSAPEYNEVRHAGVTMGLYQAAVAGLPGALRSADLGTDWALDELHKHDGWAALSYRGRITTGATSLLAAALIIRREATDETRYDHVLRRLGRFLVLQIEPSGAVLAEYDPVSGAPVTGEYSKYYTGEAFWALALLHRAFPGEGWGDAADRIAAYLVTSRDEVEGHWPAVPDHWAAYGLAEVAQFPERSDPPLTEPEVDYARRQAELFGVQTRWVSQRFGPWGGLVRGSYVPRGGGYGVTGEALTGWWLTAQEEPRLADLKGPVAQRATCIAGLALEAQSDSEDAARAAAPERVEGAWLRDGETRMDDQQHALAGMLRTIPIVEAGERSSAGSSSAPTNDAPSGWLWAVVMVLVLNPARAAFGVPRAGRSRPDPVALAAAGGAIGALAVCVAAALADALFDAIDISDPSFRVAAGTVAAIAGAGDLFRRPPPPEPSLPGWRAALIPVAIPVVARPALLVVALGAGAEGGVPVSAGAMATGVVLLVGLVAGWPTEPAGDRVLRWTARVLAAALIAGGVILTIDGVMDV